LHLADRASRSLQPYLEKNVFNLHWRCQIMRATCNNHNNALRYYVSHASRTERTHVSITTQLSCEKLHEDVVVGHLRQAKDVAQLLQT
jgi:hypothetical protein